MRTQPHTGTHTQAHVCMDMHRRVHARAHACTGPCECARTHTLTCVCTRTHLHMCAHPCTCKSQGRRTAPQGQTLLWTRPLCPPTRASLRPSRGENAPVVTGPESPGAQGAGQDVRQKPRRENAHYKPGRRRPSLHSWLVLASGKAPRRHTT